MQECFLQEYLSDTITSEAALFVPYNFPYRTFPGWKHTRSLELLPVTA